MTECPKCLSAGTVMVSRDEKKGFDYVKCSLCEGVGVVSLILHQDFVQNTHIFEDDDTESYD